MFDTLQLISSGLTMFFGSFGMVGVGDWRGGSWKMMAREGSRERTPGGAKGARKERKGTQPPHRGFGGRVLDRAARIHPPPTRGDKSFQKKTEHFSET